MILFPAIDLKNGQCVRLLRGDMAAATVFNDDPAAQARAFDIGQRHFREVQWLAALWINLRRFLPHCPAVVVVMDRGQQLVPGLRRCEGRRAPASRQRA